MNIVITADPATSAITVNPSAASVNRSELVTWSVQGGVCSNLTISFPNKTPFSTQQLSAAGAAVEGGILPNAAQIGYPYIVACVVDGRQYITPPPLDPEIIVM